MSRSEHPTEHGPSGRDPGESAILDAIETPDDGAFEAFCAAIPDERLAARVRAMRGDRATLVAADPGPAPEGLGDWALDDAMGALDPDALAALEATPSSIDGPPVSAIQPYREPVLARLWRYRGVAGVAAAAALVVVAGIGINTGVNTLRARRASPAPTAEPIAEAPGGDVPGASIEIAAETPAVAAETPESWTGSGLSEPEAWDAVALADVFEAAPHLGSGRLIVCVRSGSASGTRTVLERLSSQRIGPDHSFRVGDPVGAGTLASIGMPRAEPPVIASASGGPDRVVVPERGAWGARVRPTASALAALRKSLEDAGMAVEFRLLAEPIEVSALDRGDGESVTPDSVLWWSTPPSSWDRTVGVPVVIDSLPD